MGWADCCALEFGLTAVHWSQFGIKEERQMKNGRPSQELHGGGDCFNLIFFNLVLLYQKVLWLCAGFLIAYKNTFAFLTSVNISV